MGERIDAPVKRQGFLFAFFGRFLQGIRAVSQHFQRLFIGLCRRVGMRLVFLPDNRGVSMETPLVNHHFRHRNPALPAVFIEALHPYRTRLPRILSHHHAFARA